MVICPPKRTLLEQLFARPQALEIPALLRRYTTSSWARGGFFYLMPCQPELR